MCFFHPFYFVGLSSPLGSGVFPLRCLGVMVHKVHSVIRVHTSLWDKTHTGILSLTDRMDSVLHYVATDYHQIIWQGVICNQQSQLWDGFWAQEIERSASNKTLSQSICTFNLLCTATFCPFLTYFKYSTNWDTYDNVNSPQPGGSGPRGSFSADIMDAWMRDAEIGIHSENSRKGG